MRRRPAPAGLVGESPKRRIRSETSCGTTTVTLCSDALHQKRKNILYAWPSHFPAQCPPASAVDLAGPLFRFINGRQPRAEDFLSYYEKNPGGWATSCNARGLSSTRNWEDALTMRAGVPALRKKKAVFGNINEKVGLIAVTPSGTCRNHCTWWRFSAPESVVTMFQLYEESSKASHA